MGLLQLAATVLALGSSVQAAPANDVAARQAGVKYCDPVSTICYSEWISPEKIAFRTAIPENATATADFDVLVQIQAPKSVGWAGIAWGGTMVNNPLTVAWPNAQTVVVSSRRATARTYPQPWTGATYTVLGGTVSNSTHWTVNFLAKGVSNLGSSRLNPSSTAASIAYGQSYQAPSSPADPASRFGIHNSRGKFSHNLALGKISNFRAAVAQLASEA
jgi:hypothetical protein